MWGSDAEQREFGRLWTLWYGNGADRDRAAAIAEFRRLAAQGYAPAAFALGDALQAGESVPHDMIAAFALYQQAAEARYPPAEGAIGNCHIIAEPPHEARPYDPAIAANWHERAAEHGNMGAQYNLAFSYSIGRGVEKDDAKAYLWASLAVHCSPIRMRPAETLRDQSAALLDPAARARLDEEIAARKQRLPHIWSEHMTYWKSLAARIG